MDTLLHLTNDSKTTELVHAQTQHIGSKADDVFTADMKVIALIP